MSDLERIRACLCCGFEIEDSEFPDQCCCGHTREEHNSRTGICEVEESADE